MLAISLGVRHNVLATSIAFACIYLFSTPAIGTILGLYFLGCIYPPALFLAIVIVMAKADRLELAFYPVSVDSLVLGSCKLTLSHYLKR